MFKNQEKSLRGGWRREHAYLPPLRTSHRLDISFDRGTNFRMRLDDFTVPIGTSSQSKQTTKHEPEVKWEDQGKVLLPWA
jgi:hypothetical protein